MAISSSRCSFPTGERPSRRSPEIETGPLVRLTDEKKEKTRNFASLLRDPFEKDLMEYYVTGQLAMINASERRDQEDRRAGDDLGRRCVAGREVLPRDAHAEAVLVHRAVQLVRHVGADLGCRREDADARSRIVRCVKAAAMTISRARRARPNDSNPAQRGVDA